MKTYRISFLSLLLLFQVSIACFAQNINWKQVSPENKHLIYAGAGLNFGAVASVGYGYQLNTPLPILVNTEFSAPFGNNIFDDFKTKLGGQAQVWHGGNFSAAVKIYGVFRRYESTLVRMENFGSETGAVLGFYKRKWYVAAEFDFDKAITTHVHHSPVMLDDNPSVRDGWYIPTGGNALYGIQTGLSFGKNDLSLSLGKMVTQDFKTAPTLPFYLQLGYGLRF